MLEVAGKFRMVMGGGRGMRKTLLLEAKVFNIGEKELCGTKKG